MALTWASVVAVRRHFAGRTKDFESGSPAADHTENSAVDYMGAGQESHWRTRIAAAV